MLTGQRLLITGGTGSLGQVLVRRLLSGELGNPAKVIVFSRDEAKQHQMRVDYLKKKSATDEIIYRNFERVVEFWIGDVRDPHSVSNVIRDVDYVFNAAALKQVPACEYFPFEAVRTNIEGAENIVHAIRAHNVPVKAVVGISTDKACKPVNVMGMTKAIQERVFIRANLDLPRTRLICVRYGNVLASRGSVIPLFHEQIRAGGPVTITTPEMTRFLLSLNQAVDLIFAALKGARRGETYIPRIPASRMVDVASALIGNRGTKIVFTGIRPGEKVNEVLVSEEEAWRTILRGAHYVIRPILPELCDANEEAAPLGKEYTSDQCIMNPGEVIELLQREKLMLNDVSDSSAELIR